MFEIGQVLKRDKQYEDAHELYTKAGEYIVNNG